MILKDYDGIRSECKRMKVSDDILYDSYFHCRVRNGFDVASKSEKKINSIPAIHISFFFSFCFICMFIRVQFPPLKASK